MAHGEGDHAPEPRRHEAHDLTRQVVPRARLTHLLRKKIEREGPAIVRGCLDDGGVRDGLARPGHFHLQSLLAESGTAAPARGRLAASPRSGGAPCCGRARRPRRAGRERERVRPVRITLLREQWELIVGCPPDAGELRLRERPRGGWIPETLTPERRLAPGVLGRPLD